MMNRLFQRFHENLDLQNLFYKSQIAFGILLILAFWFLRPKSSKSNFRIREADLKKKKGTQQPQLGQPDPLAESKIRKPEIFRLSGIQIDGRPHEILGVEENASKAQIQQAYRDLMKRYHPDRIGRQGSREWNDAQKIAEAINRAKDWMMKHRS